MQHLQKLINIFHNIHSDKATAISSPIDPAPLMAKAKFRPEALTSKQKQDQLAKANGTNKCAKKTWVFNFYLYFDLVLLKAKEFFLVT